MLLIIYKEYGMKVNHYKEVVYLTFPEIDNLGVVKHLMSIPPISVVYLQRIKGKE